MGLNSKQTAGGLAVLAATAALCLAGCPAGSGGQAAGRPASQAGVQQPPPAVRIALIASDMGLGDGAFVREADAELSDLAQDGVIGYQLVGELPEELTIGAGGHDVGMPHASSGLPGEMTLGEAEAILDTAGQSNWLVLANWQLVDPALERISSGEIQADLILVLDDEGQTSLAKNAAVPVYAISYDIRPAAFICGVAAAASSNNGMFTIMANTADPHAQDFLDAAWTGAKFHTNGAIVADTILPVDEQTGLITPETFRRLHQKLNEQMGPYFKSNHFVLALGRATPSIMDALTLEPFNGYVTGAYADYRAVRQGRVLGCALKRPGAALAYIFGRVEKGEDLAAIADETGAIKVGLPEDAVGFTDFDLYSRFNPDGDDIAQTVQGYWSEIQVGELDVPALIKEFRKKEQRSD